MVPANIPHVLACCLSTTRSRCSRSPGGRLQVPASVFQQPLHHAVDTSSEARKLVHTTDAIFCSGTGHDGLIRDGDESRSRSLLLTVVCLYVQLSFQLDVSRLTAATSNAPSVPSPRTPTDPDTNYQIDIIAACSPTPKCCLQPLPFLSVRTEWPDTSK
jgi:hypothetical protein